MAKGYIYIMSKRSIVGTLIAPHIFETMTLL